MKKTTIVYETELDCWYDLEENAYQRMQMIGKAQRMAERFGSIEAFRKRLDDEMQSIRLMLNQKVAKWFTLKKQIEFIDKMISGEIKTSDESEDDHGIPGPEAAH